jgi:hypothetical protein
VQGHNLPSKLAICSLHPDKGVFHCPLQLIFSTKVTFFLLPTNPELAVGEPSALLTPVRRAESERKRSRIDKGEPRGGFEGEKGFVDAKTEVSTILPTVHLMGYYEAFDESFSNSDEGDDEDNEDHSDEDEFVSVKKKAASKKSAIEGGNSRGNESSPKGVVGARRGR